MLPREVPLLAGGSGSVRSITLSFAAKDFDSMRFADSSGVVRSMIMPPTSPNRQFWCGEIHIERLEIEGTEERKWIIM